MHETRVSLMCFFFSLIPATFFTTIGFFVLFAASSAEGRVKGFGQILAVWIFVIALFPLIAGVYATWSGQCPMDQMMENISKRSAAQ